MQRAHLLGCGSSSRAKKAEAAFRISFARRSSRFSRSSSLIRCVQRSWRPVAGRRRPRPVAPICAASRAHAELLRDRQIAAHSLGYSPRARAPGDRPLPHLHRIPNALSHRPILSRDQASRFFGAIQGASGIRPGEATRPGRARVRSEPRSRHVSRLRGARRSPPHATSPPATDRSAPTGSKNSSSLTRPGSEGGAALDKECTGPFRALG